MQIIKHDININFVGKRKLALIVSAVMIFIGLASLVVNGGPNYGIDFVGGIRGLGELEKRVNSGEMKVAFALFPTSMSDLLAVADAGEVMPPKSTWFEPKLADGLVSLPLE